MHILKEENQVVNLMYICAFLLFLVIGGVGVAACLSQKKSCQERAREDQEQLEYLRQWRHRKKSTQKRLKSQNKSQNNT